MTSDPKAPSQHTTLASFGNGTNSSASGTPVDVLVAENNETNKFYIESVLTDFGLSFKTVVNGLQVVEAYKASQPRIILMDIAMPLSDGVEATTVIRRYEKRTNMTPVPIIALSANAIPGLRERYLSAGMDDYLLKPYSLDQIGRKLEQWMLPSSGNLRPKFSSQRADLFAGS